MAVAPQQILFQISDGLLASPARSMFVVDLQNSHGLPSSYNVKMDVQNALPTVWCEANDKVKLGNGSLDIAP
jgi:hypothetical protein